MRDASFEQKPSPAVPDSSSDFLMLSDLQKNPQVSSHIVMATLADFCRSRGLLENIREKLQKGGD